MRLCNQYHLNLSYCERLAVWSGCVDAPSALNISGCNIQNQVLFECLFLTSHLQKKKKVGLVFLSVI